MASSEVKEIKTERLLLDGMNPRHDILNDQPNIMKQMIDGQSDKLVKLATDILDSTATITQLLNFLRQSGSRG